MMQRRGILSGWGKKKLLLFLTCLFLAFVGAKKETDYYKILGLPKNCSERDVTRAYRKQALKWHPDKNRDDPKKAEQRFKDVSEAYEVLHDAEKRKMYDLYGKEGVFAAAGGGGGGPRGNGGGSWSQGFSGSGGVPNFRPSQGSGGATFFSFGGDHDEGARGGMDGASFGGFTDPRELFEGLFGEGSTAGGSGRNGASSLFDSFFGAPLFDDVSGGHSGGAGGGETRRPRTARGPPVQKDFWCSLGELCEGCEKKMKVTEEMIDPRTGEPRRLSRVYRIAVEPGWKEGTRVTFPPTSEGLRSICFVMRQKPHRYFKREGDCLVYECRLTEAQARKGVRVSVPMLTKSDPPVEITTKGQKISEGKEMLLPGLGMPRRGAAKGTRGAFKVRFRLQQRSGKAFAA